MTKTEFIKQLTEVLDKHNVKYKYDSKYEVIEFDTLGGHPVFVNLGELSVSVSIYENRDLPSTMIAGYYPFYEKINSVHDGNCKDDSRFDSVFISESLTFYAIQVR